MADEENDVHLLRASSGMVAKVLREISKLVRKPTSTHLNSILSQLEPFQGDPQLLDIHLKELVPPVVAAYLEQVEQQDSTASRRDFIGTSQALSKILYTLCKIRGEPPIVGFFNNEPHYLELLVDYFEKHDNGSLSWEERYMLLLWLSHLSLTPFDLNTISTQHAENLDFPDLVLPAAMPPIAARILRLSLKHFSASSREMKAAAKLATRLCIRPDMKQIRVPNSMIQWALNTLESKSSKSFLEDSPSIFAQKQTGLLVFLSYIVATSIREVYPYLTQIYSACQRELEDYDEKSTISASSSVTKRILMKLLRNIALLCLSSEADLATHSPSILEEIIGQLLESLGDKETPIRTTASKALSIITLKLPPEMAEEVIQSIIESFAVSISPAKDTTPFDLTQIDAAQWHGLTLTLGHLLFRGAPPASQLPEILRILLLALNFEQRSPTGVSIGANARDAANFGIWSLSRRYSSSELALVDVNAIKEIGRKVSFSNKPNDNLNGPACIQQLLASELLASACLDPTGNVRRGSSAALQELVGRHPDTILAGISLIQIVDYHAVGLRERAIVQVAPSAAALGEPSIYLTPLFRHLLGWRGIRSGDAASRVFAARAIGRLSKIADKGLFEAVVKDLETMDLRDIERRHGLLFTLAALLDTQCDRFVSDISNEDEPKQSESRYTSLESLTKKSWALFSSLDSLRLSERDFASAALRPDLTTLAVATLIASLAKASAALQPLSTPPSGLDSALHLVPFCLSRFDDAVLNVTSHMARNLVLMSNDSGRLNLARTWLAEERKGNARTATRQSGYVLALGATFSHLDGHDQRQESIIDTLCKRCSSEVEVETRVIALKALKWVLDGKGRTSKGKWRTLQATPNLPSRGLGQQTVKAILACLDDYTINERGDVGSLVRLQAIETLESLPQDLASELDVGELLELLQAALRRLSVEKLDKVRLKASESFLAVPRLYIGPSLLQSVSSYEYFFHIIQDSFLGPSPRVAAAVFEGLATSAGGGASETVVQNVRAALFGVVAGMAFDATGIRKSMLLDLCNIFIDVLRQNLNNERVLSPLLDTFGFLFDVGILQRLVGTEFKWRALLSLVQKSHYKSSSIPKILSAITCYRGLAEIDVMREDVLKKLHSMLKHPFPKIREATVEALFILTQDDALKTSAATL